MPTILFAHRDAGFYVPRIRAAFPTIEVLSAQHLTQVGDEIAEAEAIFASGPGFEDERIAKAKRLKWIQAMMTGTDSILALRTLRPEVVVTSTRGIHGPQMSEMALMHMLTLARDFPRMVEQQKKAIWRRWTQTRLYGKTVVILGVGLIATALAPRCKALGMTVIGVTGTPRQVPGFDRMVSRSELLEAVSLADFLVLLAPQTPENDKIVNARVLAAMKPSAYLVNISRGGLCDEEALLEALRAKRIAGAGLDVFQAEPLPADSPFWKMGNVIITPHCAGSSDDNPELTWPIIETNMKCFLEGRLSEMINIVPR